MSHENVSSKATDILTVHDPWGPRTQWTLIKKAAGLDGTTNVGQAWSALFEKYREPVTRAVSRLLRGRSDSEDVANDFFAYLFEQEVLPKIDPDQGRFRCFIQGVLRRYVLQRLRKDRGDGAVSLEGVEVSATLRTFEDDDESDWACAVLDHGFCSLRSEDARKADLLARAYGIGEWEKTDREVLRSEFDLKGSALDVAIHRSRRRLGELIVREVRETVATRKDFDDELEMIRNRLLLAHPDLIRLSS